MKTPSAEHLWNLRSCGKNIDKNIQSARSHYDNLRDGKVACEEKFVSSINNLYECSKTLIYGCRNARFYKPEEIQSQYGELIQFLQDANSLAGDLVSLGCPGNVKEAAEALYELTEDWPNNPVPELPIDRTPLKPEKTVHRPKNSRKPAEMPNRSLIKKQTYESRNKPKRLEDPAPRAKPEASGTPHREPWSVLPERSRVDYEIVDGRLKAYLNRQCQELDERLSQMSQYNLGSGKRPWGAIKNAEEITTIANDMFLQISKRGNEDEYKLYGTLGDYILGAHKSLKKLANKFPEFEGNRSSLASVLKQWKIRYTLSKPISKGTIY